MLHDEVSFLFGHMRYSRRKTGHAKHMNFSRETWQNKEKINRVHFSCTVLSQ